MVSSRKRALAALAVAGAAGVAAAARRVVALDPHLIHTTVGLALVVTIRRTGEPIRVLRTGGVYQSATFLGEKRMEPVFAYYRAFGRVFDLVPEVRRLLVIGGGGFAFPKLVAAEHPRVRTDVVEIDPAMIRAARRWFFLDEAACAQRAAGGELNVICDDGRAVLERAEPARYDAVVADAFVGAEPVRHLATLEAARAAHRALAPHGVYLANVVSRGQGSDVGFLRSVVATLRLVFAHVAMVPATDEVHAEEDNYLVVASDAPLALPDALAYDEDFLGPVLLDADM